MDWSWKDQIVIALGNIVYYWASGTNQIEKVNTGFTNDTISNVSWNKCGDNLIIGYQSGMVNLVDISTK